MIDRKYLEQVSLFNLEPPSRHARAMLKALGEPPVEHALYLLQLLQWAIDNLGLGQSSDLQELHDQLDRMQDQGRAYRLLTGDDGTGGMATGKFESENDPREAALRLARLALDLLPR